MMRPVVGLALSAVSRSQQRAAPRLIAASLLRPRALAHYSTSAVLRNTQPQSEQPRKPSNPDMPSFSLNSLGVSRNMKLVIYALFGMCASIESWFYCRAAWRWWKGSEPEPEAEPEAEAAK
ncbi:hypothetical protein AURDEDRAFT_114868 [Auricularia subglabra TFB-10046 SS5]|nr:hypothetical protein AURDEDRAFT_114868 [Auricularia subglabra TFB-10046 SS5]